MAERKTSYPMLPVSHWWQLRKNFKRSIPGTVTASYLAASLNMKEVSARTNVLPYLEQLGIIDNEGKTLDRARQWRDDAQYADVCKEMREEVYPQELRDAVPDPTEDRAAATRWFANHTGKGEAAVNRMVATYSLLMEADASKEQDKSTRSRAEGTGKSNKPASKKTTSKPKAQDSGKRDEKPNQSGGTSDGPGVYINLQVHVSSDATPDQIDQIFASMAKHIYRKE
jgi:hypothetical protein